MAYDNVIATKFIRLDEYIIAMTMYQVNFRRTKSHLLSSYLELKLRLPKKKKGIAYLHNYVDTAKYEPICSPAWAELGLGHFVRLLILGQRKLLGL